MATHTATSILSSMQQRYGSLENPRFDFVETAIDDRPYDALVRELDTHFSVEEDTDPNDDVSFGFLLRRDTRRWVLRLSMVGPYAALTRLRGHRVFLVDPDRTDLSDVEQEILGIVQAHGLTPIDQATLTVRVPLRLHNTDPENVRLYQALFTDTDWLPWERQ